MSSEHRAAARFVSVLARPLAVAALSVAAVSAASVSVAPGASVTYRDAAGREWCGTVKTLSVGVDATSWAWVSIDADPRRVVHAAVSELEEGCKPARPSKAKNLSDLPSDKS